MRIAIIAKERVRRDGGGALLYGSEERSSRLLHVVDSSFVRFHEARRAGLAELVLVDRAIVVRIHHGEVQHEGRGGIFGNRFAIWRGHAPCRIAFVGGDGDISSLSHLGATGYVLKDTSSDEVLKAFQRVRENRPYLSHDLASEVAFMEARGTTNPLRRMTVRELQTLALVAEGKPYGVIAENLHVSYKTVANTCTQLKAKLGVRTLPELMRIAIQHLPSATAKVPRD